MPVPYVIVGDPAYPLLHWLIKGYWGAQSDASKQIFNERLSASRVQVEIALGRLKARWRCLCKRLEVHHTRAVTIIAAFTILHNIVEYHGQAVPDGWQRVVTTADEVYPQPGDDMSNNQQALNGLVIRDVLKNYSARLN